MWGLPAGVLSDNGLCFSGKLRGFEVLFEANLRDAGIRPFTGRPYHPQTTGKVERFQQTLKKWLRRQDRRHGLARDLAELQARLDEFCALLQRPTPPPRHRPGHPAQPLAGQPRLQAGHRAARRTRRPRIRAHTVTVNHQRRASTCTS